MRKLETNPTIVDGHTIKYVSARVMIYDLDSQRCEVHFKLFDENFMVFHLETWNVPPQFLENWGIDDTVIFEAIANYKGFTLKQ